MNRPILLSYTPEELKNRNYTEDLNKYIDQLESENIHLKHSLQQINKTFEQTAETLDKTSDEISKSILYVEELNQYQNNPITLSPALAVYIFFLFFAAIVVISILTGHGQ